MNYSR
jgi:hypothetical protein